jgi:hypothetical protein
MTAPDQNAKTVEIILATEGPSIHDILIGSLHDRRRISGVLEKSPSVPTHQAFNSFY